MQILLVLVALMGLVAVWYTHLRLRFHSDTVLQRRATRLILIGVGTAFGLMMSYLFSDAGPLAGVQPGLTPWLVFVSAFGITHVPAACILFLKRQRQRA
jgi:type VI protein secretion system component VasK